MFRTAFKTSALSPRPRLRNFTRSIIARNARPTEAPKHATPLESSPYLNIKLPDLSAPLPEAEVHIPFTPDFWESSRAKAEAARALPEEPQIPKVIVVAGDSARADSTHIFAAHPDHVTVDHHHHAEPASVPKASNLRSLFLDVADDLMLPKDLSALKPSKGQLPLQDHLFEEKSTSSTGLSRFHFRTLDSEQVRGVWVIVGLLAGSWLAGGLLKKNSKYAESE